MGSTEISDCSLNEKQKNALPQILGLFGEGSDFEILYQAAVCPDMQKSLFSIFKIISDKKKLDKQFALHPEVNMKIDYKQRVMDILPGAGASASCWFFVTFLSKIKVQN